MRHNRQPILMSMLGKVTVFVHVQVLVRSSLLSLDRSIDRSIVRLLLLLLLPASCNSRHARQSMHRLTSVSPLRSHTTTHSRGSLGVAVERTNARFASRHRNQTKPNQTKPNQTKPNPNQTEPNQTKPNQSRESRTERGGEKAKQREESRERERRKANEIIIKYLKTIILYTNINYTYYYIY